MGRVGALVSDSARRSVRAASLSGVAALSLFLGGCPLSDDYYVKASGGSAGSPGPGGAAGNGGSSAGTQSTGGESSGASGGTSGNAGSSGSGATGGSSGRAGSGGSGGSMMCAQPCDDGACRTNCETGWTDTAAVPNGFVAREKFAYTSTEDQLFVWGGIDESDELLGDGALYDPERDEWTPVASQGAPSPRYHAMAVWTGAEICVWGGAGGTNRDALSNGAFYNPVTDSWRPMVTGLRGRAGAASGLFQDSVLWFWGGVGESDSIVEGVSTYTVATDVWGVSSDLYDPGPLVDAAWASGSFTLWIYGGLENGTEPNGTTTYYSNMTNGWLTVGPAPLQNRSGSFSTIVDQHFMVWGGRSTSGALADGAGYYVGFWSTMGNQNAPTRRYRAELDVGWTLTMNDEQLAVVGGLEAPSQYVQDGGIYDITTDTWSDIEAWPSAATHRFGAAVFAGGQIVIWGGYGTSSLTTEGHRYLPSTTP